MNARLVPALIAATMLVACGGSAALATPTPTDTPKPTATPTSAAATSAAATATTGGWTVTSASKATVKVREQLAGVSFPSDAVLTATGAVGTFALKPDGTFSADSKITFDLNSLSSDERQRDQFIKMDTLEVRRFPTATLVPTRVDGLALPLASSGTFTFKLTGKLTIKGVPKDVAFDVVAKREGANLTATATLAPTVKFGDFGMQPPSTFRVLSIVDEIRLVVDLVATGSAA